jgi:thiosulfate/3-mercaptopyruvate sulfurtransferase
MRSKISYILILLCVFSCKKHQNDIAPINYLIEFDEFQQIANNPTTKVIDFRKPQQYADGHLPNAINIWRSAIEDTSYPYKGMMAPKKTIEILFSSLGITPGDLLVVYDDNGLCDAARFWWVLQQFGHTNVRLLHGGYSGWKQNNYTITTELPNYPNTSFSFKNKVNSQLYINKEKVVNSLENVTILDTRTPDEYSGKRQKKGAFKGGRIPKSIAVDWTSAIDYHGTKKIKSIAELEKIYSAHISSKKDPVIVYCHSGVRSAHTIFVLTQLLGYENVRNYDGSWTEWSYFDNLPFEKDSITTIKR